VHQFSFDFPNPVLDVRGWRIALQVITFENTYGLDAAHISRKERSGITNIQCGGLATAAGQKAGGRAWLQARPRGDSLDLVAGAEHAHKIRCLKVVVSGLPRGNLVGRRWESAAAVPPAGVVYRYPFDIHSALPRQKSSEDGSGLAGVARASWLLPALALPALVAVRRRE
jgi:hypothetical protein